MASLTKIMTALVVVERTRPAQPVRITQAALNYSGSGVGMLPKGRRVRAETLLNGLLIVSGNDAAIALAVGVAGSERRFVRLMNRHARRWGLTCTRFASSHGLEPGNRSCARDLAALARRAMSKPRIRRITRLAGAVLPFPIKGGKLYLTGHNPLIRLRLPGRDRAEDGLHRRGGALLRRRRATGRPAARRGAAELAGPVEAGAEAAGRGIRDRGLSAFAS